MHIETLATGVAIFNREMYLNRYGHAGIPVVVFASSGGSHNEYYDFGMIEACASLSGGRAQFFTLSSVDSESVVGHLEKWARPSRDASCLRALCD